jgi:HAD superfamily hydrolase (TIGR01544 family)
MKELSFDMKDIKKEDLYVISDFDRTLSKGIINGKKVPSIMSLLRDGKHLNEGYAEKAKALFEKYHPMEKNLSLPLEERKKYMKKWWEEHNNLLIESGLKFSDLEDIANNGRIEFREGVLEFLDKLNKNKIPLVVFSSSGCGEAIKIFFKKYNRDYDNTFYITNRFNWGENGEALSIKGKIIDVLSKGEIYFNEFPKIWQRVKEKGDVILVGDSLSDVDMAKHVDYKNIFKIGFLNGSYNDNGDEYRKVFDLVLDGKEGFEKISEIIDKIVY